LARGPYTGSIGGWTDEGESFNVAIRTLVMGDKADHARLGLGSGIVADSTAGAEWRECLAKGAFVTAGARRFDLIETMLFDPELGIAHLDRHLARLRASAAALGFVFDRHALRNELQAASFRLAEPRRLRILLSPSGAVAIEVRPLPPAPPGEVEVALMPLPVPPEDFRLHHKTTDRGFYDRARAESGCFEVGFVDATGFVTEGSFTNIFVKRGAVLTTPPLTRGLLPGVLRQQLVEEGRAVEGDLTATDLQRGFFIGNALRGLIPARLVAGNATEGL
ncbi:MAG: para-aminobenzoate synthase component, partial [Sphingomonas bacterium]|nr:para-aminobenzoate synthase component [Sphingomonas bacterium]